MKKFPLAIFIALVWSPAWTAPTVSGVSGTLTHGTEITISGSSFGSKVTAAPVAWDNFSQDTIGNAPSTTATVGSWTSVGWKNSGDHSTPFIVSTSHARYTGARSVVANCNEYMESAFTGGENAQTWYVQYWFYLDNDWTWGASDSAAHGNDKIFRMWSAGSSDENFVIATSGQYDVHVNMENTAGAGSEDWHPVVSGYNWVDQVMGHSEPGYVANTYCGWMNFENDITLGAWHLFQFEWRDSDAGSANGVFRWWFDGKLIMDKTLLTRDTGQTQTKRPKYVGIAPVIMSGYDGNDHFYMTDPYIDNTWCRVEIGNANTYAACTHREIQPTTAWATGEIKITLNRGSFAADDTAYLYVVDSDGAVNASGLEIAFGDTEDPAPAPPTLSNVTISGVNF